MFQGIIMPLEFVSYSLRPVIRYAHTLYVYVLQYMSAWIFKLCKIDMGDRELHKKNNERERGR